MAQSAESLFALGKLQTNYTTEVVIANDEFRQLVKDGYDKPVFSSPNVTNAGQSTGSAYATKVSKDKDDVTFSGTERGTFQALGFHAVGSFGNYATPVVISAGAVWQHTFTLLSPFVTSALPTRPLASKVGDPVVTANRVFDVRFPSMMYEDITFSAEGNAADLQIASNWRGSGKRVVPSGVQFIGAGKDVLLDSEITENYIRKSAGVLTLNDDAALAGSNTLPGCGVRDTIIKINENLNTDNYNCPLFQDGNPDRGAIRGEMLSGGQTIEFSTTMLLTPSIATDFDPLAKLYSGASVSVKIKFTGALITGIYFHEATFTLNKGVIASMELVDYDGIQGVRLVFEPLAVSDIMPLSLVIQTDVANFNTYVG